MSIAGPLSGQLALVTGASRGIGAATANALAAAGAHVILTARAGKDLEAVEQAIYETGGLPEKPPMMLNSTETRPSPLPFEHSSARLRELV